MRRIALAITAVASLAAAAVVAWGLLGDDADRRGARVGRLEVDSAATGGLRELTTVVPPGAADGDRRPLLIFLHGRGGEGDDVLFDELFAALEALGEQAPVIVAPDAEEAAYWHDRSGGAWGRYVVDEVIGTALRELPADPRRVAIGGISMGGFGALDVARLNPGRFCAVGAHSPALWRTGGETAPGAFDHAEDFARHDVIGAAAASPKAFAAAPLWVDAGEEDPFVPGIDAFVAALERHAVDVTHHRWPGGHEGAYWRDHIDEYLRFYAESCA